MLGKAVEGPRPSGSQLQQLASPQDHKPQQSKNKTGQPCSLHLRSQPRDQACSCCQAGNPAGPSCSRLALTSQLIQSTLLTSFNATTQANLSLLDPLHRDAQASILLCFQSMPAASPFCSSRRMAAHGRNFSLIQAPTELATSGMQRLLAALW